MFEIRFDPKQIRSWADRDLLDLSHEEQEFESQLENGFSSKVKERGYYTKKEFLTLALWKSRRPRRRYERNPSALVKEVTGLALSAKAEQLRIMLPTVLDGVAMPTASVLLHFGSTDPYPILDFRALWSLGIDASPVYTFDFWWDYTEYCRKIATENGVSMRTLDRALWQYSKEQQPKTG